MVRKHLAPDLGHIPLARLSAQAIQGYLSAKLRAKPLSPTSIAYQFGILREALRHAIVQFREPKTERGRRPVALPPLLVNALRLARGDAR